MDLLLQLVLVVSCSQVVRSCTTAQVSGSMADRIAESGSVVWGYVVAVEHDRNQSVNGLRVYNAEVRVKCVMKGQVTSRIKVIKLGDAPKRCVHVDVQLNQNYIFMLNKAANSAIEYTADVKQDLYSTRRLSKVTSYCGISLSQPMNEAYTEQGYVDCSGLIRRHRRKRPCTTLPQTSTDNNRTKKEKTPERKPGSTSRKNRLDARQQQGDRPEKGQRERIPRATSRPRLIIIRPRKNSAAMTLRTQLYTFLIFIAFMLDNLLL